MSVTLYVATTSFLTAKTAHDKICSFEGLCFCGWRCVGGIERVGSSFSLELRRNGCTCTAEAMDWDIALWEPVPKSPSDDFIKSTAYDETTFERGKDIWFTHKVQLLSANRSTRLFTGKVTSSSIVSFYNVQATNTVRGEWIDYSCSCPFSLDSMVLHRCKHVVAFLWALGKAIDARLMAAAGIDPTALLQKSDA